MTEAKIQEIMAKIVKYAYQCVNKNDEKAEDCYLTIESALRVLSGEVNQWKNLAKSQKELLELCGVLSAPQPAQAEQPKAPREPMTKYKTESTWQEGANAARAGYPRSANPYETQDFTNHFRVLDMEGWDNGWTFAKKTDYLERFHGITKDGK